MSAPDVVARQNGKNVLFIAAKAEGNRSHRAVCGWWCGGGVHAAKAARMRCSSSQNTTPSVASTVGARSSETYDQVTFRDHARQQDIKIFSTVVSARTEQKATRTAVGIHSCIRSPTSSTP